MSSLKTSSFSYNHQFSLHIGIQVNLYGMWCNYNFSFAEMASQSIDDILRQFLTDNEIHTTDEGKVIEVLKELGIQDEKSLGYLAMIEEDDISNKETG